MMDNFMRLTTGSKSRLGLALKIHRITADKKQKDVAAAANISTNYLSLIEHGARDPRLFVLCEICNAIGVKVWKVIRAAENSRLN